MKTSLKWMLALSTSLAVAMPAYAQSNAEEDSSGLGEIVVTANRRAENMQDVPIAISAVTAETAAKLGVTDLASLTNVVPGFTFNRQGAGSQPFIRGVGNQSTTIGNEPSVAMFVDDLYIPTSNSAMFEFNNIERVEVLKGPQGTLFGRNATGGVVHVHTKDPTFDRSADLEFGYGNFQTVNAKGFVNLPMGENVAMNLAAYRTHQGEGWGRDIFTGRDVYKRSAYGARGKLLFEIGDDTSLLLSGGYNHQKGDAGMALRTVMGFAGRARLTPEQAGAGFYDGMTANGDYYLSKFAAGSAKLTHDMGGVRFVSITGYTDSKNSNNYDISAHRGNLTADYRQNEKAFTQEVQIMSNDEGPLDWIIGAFYLKDTALFDGIFFGQGPAAGTGPGGANLGPAIPAGLYSTSHAKQKTKSFSVFGQTSYEVTDALSVTLGLRYTIDKRSIGENGGELGVTGGPQLLASGPFNDSKTFKKLTGRFSLDYKINDDTMIYAAFNRGFKSGIYSTSSYNAQTAALVPAVKPESIDAWSAGLKSELLGNTLRFNIEGFWYKIKNIQVQNNLAGQPGTEIRNGGKAELKGVEAELTFQPVENFTLSGSVSVIDGKYKEFLNGPTYFQQAPNAPRPIPGFCAGNPAIYPAAGGGPIYPTTAAAPLLAVPGGCNLAGNDMLQVIPLSANLSAVYTIPMPGGGIDLAANWLHTDDYFFEPDNSSLTRQKPVDLLNASIAWKGDDGLSVRLWAQNIGKEKYYSYIAHSGTSGTKGAPAAPRTYGITLGAHF